MEKYDSLHDTLNHIQVVQDLLTHVSANLYDRKLAHDASKLQEPEKLMYDRFTPLLRSMTYGSDEYKSCLAEMGLALQHHYQNNSHHPEHYPVPARPDIDKLEALIRRTEGIDPDNIALPWMRDHLAEMKSQINGMSLLDVIEMLADWKAAGMRHADGNMVASLEINKKRFVISHQLFEILKNTCAEMVW